MKPQAHVRPSQTIVLLGVLVFPAYVLSLSACSDRAAPSPVVPPASAAPSAALPERSLAYVPGESVTDRRIARAQAAVRATPASGDALSGLAILFLRRHRETADGQHLRRAKELVDLALGVDADDPVALNLSGMLAMQAHEFAAARAVAERILTHDRQDTTALLLLGDAESELGDYDDAAEVYQRAADLRPDLGTYNRGAYVRWLHGDAAGALELHELSLDSGSLNDPESSAWCWVDLATVHWHLGNRLQVKVALERALALVPDYLPALRLKARLLVSEGRDAEAIAILTSTLERQELVGELLFLAELLESQGQHDAAAARVTRAVRIRREDTRTLAVYWLRHGLESADALGTMERELAKRHDVYTQSAHAMALARAGRFPAARQEMERALALWTPDVGLILASGLVAHLAGDDVAARAALTRARTLNAFVDPFLFRTLATELGEPAAQPSPLAAQPTPIAAPPAAAP